MTALPILFFGAFGLFLGGIVLVLLLQGYPLTGIGIMTLGLTMSSFGLTALILSWVFTGKKGRAAGAGNGQAVYSSDKRAGLQAGQTTCDAVKKTVSKEEQPKGQETAGGGVTDEIQEMYDSSYAGRHFSCRDRSRSRICGVLRF